MSFRSFAVRAAAVLALGVVLGPASAARAQNPLPVPLQAFAALAPQPATQTSFTLDRNSLQSFYQGNDTEVRHVVAGLNSVTVRNYHFSDFANYNPDAFASLQESFHSAGWQHLVSTDRNGPTTTDLWLRFANGDVTNVAVLNRGDRNMAVVTVDCDLRPLDFLHLGGLFGIPKVDPNAVMVPAPR